MSDVLNILFLSAEAFPFVKVGGLADVAGSLPAALRSLSTSQTGGYRLDVRLVLPLHRLSKTVFATLKPLNKFIIKTVVDEIEAQAYEILINGVPTYFIDGLPISRAQQVYSADSEGDREKYTFFSLAALELARLLDWKVDIVHANDWHTALSIYAIRTFTKDSFFTETAGLLTVHNLPYMGGDGCDVLTRYGFQSLPDVSLPVWARSQSLPLGLWAADAIVPVSETYAREILTPEYGYGLQDFLLSRSNSITGIINGLDVNQWDPATDSLLFEKYSLTTLNDRIKNKTSLLQKIDLNIDPGIPLIGMVTRIDYQKGIDLTIQAISRLNEKHWQLVILGSGDDALENDLNQFQAKYPDKVRVILRYDNPMSHQIYAGSDIFLMPSRYEPCGLSQMIAMRYGNVPVVHATGGLKDTVLEGKTGFVFEKSTPESQAAAISRAFRVFAESEKWLSYQRNGMQQDFSWNRSALRYSILYRSIVSKYRPGEEL